MDWKQIKVPLLGVLLLFVGTFSADAQPFSEWFKQNKTQKKYLINQLAALQVYGGYLKKGYEVASEGIGLVRGMTDGEFGLHQLFFGSLKTFGPLLSRNAKVMEMIDGQLRIHKRLKAMDLDVVSETDKSYVASVKKVLLGACLDDLEVLLLLITDGKLEMTADERLIRLDALHREMIDKLAFVQDFEASLRLLARQRQQEKKDIDFLWDLYEGNK